MYTLNVRLLSIKRLFENIPRLNVDLLSFERLTVHLYEIDIAVESLLFYMCLFLNNIFIRES